MPSVSVVEGYDRGVVGRCLRMAGAGVFGEFENVVKSCVVGRNEFWGWSEHEFDFCHHLYGFRSLVKILISEVGITDNDDLSGIEMRIGWLRDFAKESMKHAGQSHRIINLLGHLSKRLRWMGHDVVDFPRIVNSVDAAFNSRLVSSLLESGWCTAVIGVGHDVPDDELHRLLANAINGGDIVRFDGVSDVPFCFSHFMRMFDVEDLPASIVPWGVVDGGPSITDMLGSWRV